MKSIIAYISVLLIILFSTYAVAVIIETPGTGNTAKFLTPFRMLDSLGNTVVANDAYDSVKVVVWGMGGYCYYAKMLMSDARIYDTLIDGQDFFCFMDDLQDIDSTGSAGTYGYDIRVWDSTYEWWSPGQIGMFIASPTSWEEQIDSLAKMIDSLESYDDWVAKQADLQKAIDSLAKIIDSLDSYDGWVSHQSTVDSLVDSLNVLLVQQAKVIDSLQAVLDSVQAKFANRTAFDPDSDSTLLANRGEISAEVADSVLEDSSAYQGSGAGMDSLKSYGAALQAVEDISTNFVHNGNFELDSTNGTTGPAYWTLCATDSARIVPSTVNGRRKLHFTSNQADDTLGIYQWLGYLRPGQYLLSGFIRTSSIPNAWGSIVIHDGSYIHYTDFVDSIRQSTGTFDEGEYYKIVTIDTYTQYCLGLLVTADISGRDVEFDKVQFKYIGPIPIDSEAVYQAAAQAAEDMATNFVHNGNFELDSTNGTTGPAYWTLCATDSARIVPSTVNGRRKLHFTSNQADDTLGIYQYLGGLRPGQYLLSGFVRTTELTNMKGWIVIDAGASINYKGFVDSIRVGTGASDEDEFYKIVTIDNYTAYSIGLLFTADASGKYAEFDKVQFKYIEPLGTDSTAMLALAEGHPSVFYGPAGSGSGSKTYTIYVADTTGVGGGGDTAYVPGVTVSAYSLSAVLQAGMRTDTYGKVTYSTDLDSLLVVISKDNLYADPDTILVNVTGKVDTIIAYHGTIPASGSPELCTVFLSFYRGGSPVRGVKMMIRNDNMATDTTQNVVIGPYFDKAVTDSLGQAYLYVPKTYLFHDSTMGLYDITLTFGGKVLGDWSDVFIPDQDSLRLVVE